MKSRDKKLEYNEAEMFFFVGNKNKMEHINGVNRNQVEFNNFEEQSCRLLHNG